MTRTTAVALAFVFLCAQAAHAELLAGAAKSTIVPPFPTHMGGFGDRMDSFTGVHDELYVRALVLDNGETQIVIIGSGLMALDEVLTADVRDRVNASTGIPRENILVSCVHNHSAPSYYQYEEGPDRDKAHRYMVEQFASAAVAAYVRREPARMGYANGAIHGASNNRQQQNEDVIDPQVGVLRVEKGNTHEVIATVFNFTAHPVIVGSKNLLLSGEFPGEASRTVEKVLGGVAIFTQGACGDVTIHRSGDPFSEVERVGKLVAGEVIKTSSTIRTSPEARLASSYIDIPFPAKVLPSVIEAQATLREAKAIEAKAKAAGAERAVLRVHSRRIDLLEALLRQAGGVADGSVVRPKTYPGSVHVMQIGDFVIVGVPGELFVEYALEMRQRIAQLSGKSMWLVGYANGYVGYIVTPRAMQTGGYEASVARVDYHAGRVLTERAMSIVTEIVR